MWNKVSYILSTHIKEKWPTLYLPEVVIVGRSNVGKSSLINGLSNNKKLAYISKKPGKTRSLNFFNVGNQFIFVDVPGYGFAKVSRNQKVLFSNMIDEYFSKSKYLKVAIQLLDIRRIPNEDDLNMISYFNHFKIPILYVVTKIDKTNQKEINIGIKKICEKLNIKREDLILTSSQSKKGIDTLKKKIEESLFISKTD